MTSSTRQWDGVYKKCKHWCNKNPTDFLNSLLPMMPSSARIFDIGCGIGRNSIFLARQGFEVHAMDISGVAVKHLHDTASKVGIQPINIWRGDLRSEEFVGSFDLILAYGILNSIERQWWPAIFERMRKHTVPGGYNVVVVFNTLSDHLSVDGLQVVSLAEPAEIRGVYEDWDLFKVDIRTISHNHGRRRVHTHVAERFIFQKPPSIGPPSPAVFSKKTQSVAVIGPTRPSTSAKALNIKTELFNNAANVVGAFVANSGRRLVCIPDRGIVRQVFDAYSASSPVAPALVLKPDHDERFTTSHDPQWEIKLGDSIEILKGFSWGEQASVMARCADVFIAVGLSCGTLIELLWTNWSRRPVYMSLDLCSPLPPEVRSRLSVFELPDVVSMLKALDMHHPAKTAHADQVIK